MSVTRDRINTFFRYNDLFRELVVRDVKLKYRRRFLGYVWSILNPLLIMLVMTLVFSQMFQRGIENFPVYLLTGQALFDFMNNAQALIHGDLHTGSIFINKEHTYVFDPEFAFYGPMGYDIGNVIANMFFAWANGDATIKDAAQKEEFCGWVIDCIEEIVDKFIAKFKKAYQEHVTDIMAKTEGFMDYYLGTVLADTAGIAGLESIRRIVGMANNKDITTIQDEEKRARAERIIVTLAKNYIMNRTQFTSGAAYRKAIEEAIATFKN